MRGDHAPRTGVPGQVYYGKNRISTGNPRGWNGIKSSCKANFEEEKLLFPTCRGSRPHKTTSGKVNLYEVLINNSFSAEPSWEEPERKRRFSTKPVEAAIENQSPVVPTPKSGKNSKLHEYSSRGGTGSVLWGCQPLGQQHTRLSLEPARSVQQDLPSRISSGKSACDHKHSVPSQPL